MTEMNNNYYFTEMEKIPLLSVEEEKSLAAKAFSGNKTAQNKLVEANLRFVVKIANQYRSFMEIDDLINEGNLGLMHAATKYNPESGSRFTTYAVFWIKAYIQKAIRETSKGIKFPANKYSEMTSPKWHITSLDKTVCSNDGEETTLMSFIRDEKTKDPKDELMEKETITQIRNVVKALKPIEQSVITKRFGLDGQKPMSLSDIGLLMGYSKERIRQIEKKSLLKLHANMIDFMDYDDLAA